jgi:Flp pilus assembly protein TadD
VYRALTERDPNRQWTLLAGARASRARTLAIDPNAAFERALLGRTLAAQSELKPDSVSFEQARAEFAQALRGDPTNSFVLVQLEETFVQLNRDDEARFVAMKLAGLKSVPPDPPHETSVIASVTE